MSGLSEKEKKILRLKLQRKSGYAIGRELGIDPPHVYRAIQNSKKKLRKVIADLHELGFTVPELEKLLQNLELDVSKETVKEEIAFTMR